ncbi:MAG TPA: hypothetical protein VGQ57_18170 [Polyangiaceae bacterium]|jgi:hypothetical protein|nr:hypothetical protein [Polyangiaceae bacterium]
MNEPKSRESDTAPETPSSKRTIAVRTGTSDPPPSPYPRIRPAAGRPAAPAPNATGVAAARAATTLPPSVKAREVSTFTPNGFVLGAAVFAVVMSLVIWATLHLPSP